MSIFEFISHLNDLDIRLSVEDEKLRVNAPKGVLTPELKERLSAHKEEIIAFFNQSNQRKSQDAVPGQTLKITPANSREYLPLSFSQMRLWFLDQFDPGNTAYSMPLAIRFEGMLVIDTLEKGLNEILKRQASLRTTFSHGLNGQPQQIIHIYHWQDLPISDFSFLEENTREKAGQDFIKRQAQIPFDLTNGPLFRAHLLKINSECHWLFFNMPHIVSDGWSTGIFMTELSQAYQALTDGRPMPFQEPLVQYTDYAIWQRSNGMLVFQSKLEFWKKKLNGVLPILDLPADHARPKNQTFNGACPSRILPDGLASRLKQISNHQGVTLFMTMLAAFNVLLHRYTSQEDIIVGTANANRGQPETEELIGFFVNTLALRNDLSGCPTFAELLKRVRDVSLESFANREVPFEAIVESLHLARDTSRSPIFQVMFILQNTPYHEVKFPDMRVTPIYLDTGTSKYDLSLIVWEDPNEGLTCFFEYNTDIYAQERIERMIGHYQVLLESVCRNPDLPIGELELLTEDEQQKILLGWNATQMDFPRHQTIQGLITSQAQRCGDRIAVSDEEGEISYAELDRRSNQLGRYLQRLGIGPESLVGISLPRKKEMVIGLLGILKAGAAYVPLDPNFPVERLKYMLEDSQARLLLTERSLAATLEHNGLRVVCLTEEWRDIEEESPEEFDGGGQAENLAYVIYTSGSTGRPKGVEVLQRGVVNFLSSMQKQPGLVEEDILVSVTTLSFDIAGLELYLPLIKGARLLLVSSQTALDGLRLKKVIEEQDATLMQATPATWRLLMAAGWKGKQGFKGFCGGETLPAEVASGLLQRGVQLWNLYGPTETTIWSTVSRIEREDELVTIGRPIGNTRTYILDSRGQPLPVGVAGELFIAGDGVARGYLRRPDLTAEKFVADRFMGGGARMYRTGDLARYLPDGRIEFLGRIDNQVKLRGYRIELGEITSALLEHPDVKSAVVMGRKDRKEEPFLAAYIVPRLDTALTRDDLRAFLLEKLPTVMIPAQFVFLDRLPTSPNGKVDYNALPEPTIPSTAVNLPILPHDLVEVKLIQIWRNLLKLEDISTQDDFFALGGHSILAVRMFNKIQETFGVNLPLTSLFHRPTIKHLASLIKQQNGTISWSSLAEIQPTGNRPPVFCVHGMPGDVLWYCGLVPHMDQDQPLWGLESQGLDGVQQPILTIEEMASLYIKEMQSIQPKGPYYICGYSFGGSVVYEMACQLEQKGIKVGLLAIIDHANSKSGYYQVKIGLAFFKAFASNLPYRILDLFNLKPDQFIARLRRNLGYFIKSLTGGIFTRTNDELKASDLIDSADELPMATQEIIRINYKAMIEYTPRRYNGVVTLIRARGGRLFVSPDPEMGWGKFANSVDIRIIPGSHLGLFRDPNIRYLGEQLQVCLDEVQAIQ
jgi:amino acid adenylation domain-containing protein